MAIFFSQSIKKTVNAFADSFNEIYINTFKSNKLIESIIPIRFASDEKMIAFARSVGTDPETRITLPALGFSLTTIDFDEERAMNPLNKILSNDLTQYILQPVPYNYTFDLGMYVKYVGDLFNIIEQIIPIYQKARCYPLIYFKFLDGSVVQQDTPIELSAASLDLTTEDIGKEDERILKCSFTFVVKGWIFHPILNVTADSLSNIDKTTNNPKQPIGGNIAKLIQNIDMRFEENVDQTFEKLLVYEDSAGDNITQVENA